MARITTVLNQKGGVGKTTTAHALATGLNHRGFKALVIDADPQGNISYTMQADAAQAGLYEALKGIIPAADAIQHTAQGDLISSSIDLAGADMEFTQTGREYLLREVLDAISADYTHVIIDSPPSLGIMTVNALTASNDLIIPVGAEIYALQGLQQLLNTIGKVQKYSNPGLTVAGLLITRKGNKAVATRQLIDAIQQRAGALQLHLYSAVIREAVAIREAQIMQGSIFDTHPRAKVTDDYNAFIGEYIKQGA
jgi:chromosome partitioning protein